MMNYHRSAIHQKEQSSSSNYLEKALEGHSTYSISLKESKSCITHQQMSSSPSTPKRAI